TLPCYLALFALGELFELFIGLDALRGRNTIQLLGMLTAPHSLPCRPHAFCRTASSSDKDCPGDLGRLRWNSKLYCPYSFISCFRFLTVVQNCGGPGTLWAQVEPLLIVAPCVIAASWFIMLFWVKQLYAEFGWAIFHVVGANPKMKTMYQWYQIMICLLKFDFFFFAGVTMQLLIVVLQRNSAEFGVTIAAIPVVLILLIFCGIAVQREIKSVMTISLVMMLAALSYCKYFPPYIVVSHANVPDFSPQSLVRFYQPGSRERYETTRATLTVFTIIAFILLLATFAAGLRCFSDFDRGLQASKVNSLPVRPSANAHNSSQSMGHKPSMNQVGVPLGPRISIE
ncbi:hypothetical protein CVT24_007943, partial [Panaeolus cyanescens]